METVEERAKRLKKEVGRRVRALRIRAGYKSAETAAEALHVHPNSVYELERGDNWISPEMALRLSEHFNVCMAVFFTDSVVKIEPTPQEALNIVAANLGVALPSIMPANVQVERAIAEIEDEKEALELEIQRLNARIAALESLNPLVAEVAQLLPKAQREAASFIRSLLQKQTNQTSASPGVRKPPKAE